MEVGGECPRWHPGDKVLPSIEKSPVHPTSFPSGSFALSILSDLGFDMGLRCP